jgi:type I restriction enzyme R subunit
MAEQLADFKEEFSAKIPALTLLSNLGYTFIAPSDCEQYRGKSLLNKSKFNQLLGL